jgi:hypothetical protein
METDLIVLEAESGGTGHDRFTEAQQEEIKYLVRRAIYSDFNITPALVALGLLTRGYDLSRHLARHYVEQVKKEDAEAERIRAEIPDLTEIRAAHRKHREAIFSAAMAGAQLAQANRALDALAALDGVAVSKSTVTVEGKDGGPVQVEDVTQMSDAALRAALAAARARKTETGEQEAGDAD